MKKLILLFILLVSMQSFSYSYTYRSKAIQIKISNPVNISRDNTPVVITGTNLNNWGVDLSTLYCKAIVVVETNSPYNPIAFQVDDFDNDGYFDIEDEIVLLTKIKPSGTTNFYIFYDNNISVFTDVKGWSSSVGPSVKSYYLSEYWQNVYTNYLKLSTGDNIISEYGVGNRFYLNGNNHFSSEYNSIVYADGTSMLNRIKLMPRFIYRDKNNITHAAENLSSQEFLIHGPLRVRFKVVTIDTQNSQNTVESSTVLTYYNSGKDVTDICTRVYLNLESEVIESGGISPTNSPFDGKRGSWIYADGIFSDAYKYYYSTNDTTIFIGGTPTTNSIGNLGYLATMTNGTKEGFGWIQKEVSNIGDSSTTYLETWGTSGNWFIGRDSTAAVNSIPYGTKFIVAGEFFIYPPTSAYPLNTDGYTIVSNESVCYHNPLAIPAAQLLQSPLSPPSSGAVDFELLISYQSRDFTETKVNVSVVPINYLGAAMTNYRGTINFESSDSSAVLPVNYTYTESDNGGHIFTIVFNTPGPQTLTVKDINTPSVSKTERLVCGVVNLAHLDYLGENMDIDGAVRRYIWLYADYPKYERMRDAGEGKACVDDTARAVPVYLDYYNIYSNSSALSKVEVIDKFLQYMDSDKDGEWVNFIWGDNSRNEDGATSKEAYGSYTARAIWALGYSYKIFSQVGNNYKDEIDDYIDASLSKANSLYSSYGSDIHTYQGKSVHYIIFDNAVVSSWALPGWIDYYKATGNATAKSIVETTCDRILEFQDGDINTYPFETFYMTYNQKVQAYGNYIIQSLAYAYRNMDTSANRNNWLEAAKKAADNWGMFILTSEMPGSEGWNPGLKKWPKIEYSVAPLVMGFYELYKATGDTKYGKLAGLAASWFFGNNVYGVPMYHPDTGICFDGLEDNGLINRNSGGESSVEGMRAIVNVMSDPYTAQFAKFYEYKKRSYLTIEAEDASEVYNGETITEEWVGGSQYEWWNNYKHVNISPGGKIVFNFYIDNPYDDGNDNYLIYLHHIKRTDNDWITVTIDSNVSIKYDIGGAPDSNYLVYQKIPQVIKLKKGYHTVEIIAGSQTLELDAITLQPVVQKRTFISSGGETITLEKNFWTNSASPAPPDNVTANLSENSSSIKIEWSKNNNAYGYNVYRKLNSESQFVKINSGIITNNFFYDENIEKGKIYNYSVTSIDDNPLMTESSNSSVVTISVPDEQYDTINLLENYEKWDFTVSGFKLYATENNGYVDTPGIIIDLDSYPYLTIDVSNPDNNYWSLSVAKWDETDFQWKEFILQPSCNYDGRLTYNMKSQTGWSGNIRLKITISLPTAYQQILINELKVENVDTDNTYWIKTDDSQFTSYNNIDLAPYIPVTMKFEKKINNIYVYVNDSYFKQAYCEREVNADFSIYKILNLNIELNSGKWALIFVPENGAEIYINHINNFSGKMQIDLSKYGLEKYSNGRFRFTLVHGSPVDFRLTSAYLSADKIIDYYPQYKGVKAIPNPFTPLSDNMYNKTYFYFLDDAVGEIAIYTINGNKINELSGKSGEVSWDGKDSNGNLLSSGVYIYQIKCGSNLYTGTITLVK